MSVLLSAANPRKCEANIHSFPRHSLLVPGRQRIFSIPEKYSAIFGDNDSCIFIAKLTLLSGWRLTYS